MTACHRASPDSVGRSMSLRSVVTRRALLLPVAAGLFALAACTSPTQGTGTPAGPPTSEPTTATSSAAGSALAAIQPCDLISQSQATQNTLVPKGPSNEGAARNCSWSNPVADNGDGYAVEIGLRDSQGLKDINTDGFTMTDDQIGRHQGKQGEDTSTGDCLVFIGVTDTSRVDVVISDGNSDATEACQLANHYATLIEPELP